MMDPGLRNPYLFDPNNTSVIPNYDTPPPTPARRLFQVPDITHYTYDSTTFTYTQVQGRENAAELGDWRVNKPTWNGNLAQGNTDLINSTVFANITTTPPTPFNATIGDISYYYPPTPPGTPIGYPSIGYSNLLGGFNYPFSMSYPPPTAPVYNPPVDNRKHPYFRTEMMSKVMNLSTVRTHQYAVWVTVGFFEVLRPGNKQMATIDPTRVPDILGAELGLSAGTNVRYRAFAIIDRSLATGFNPSDPGDFRDVITYRRRIE